MNLSFLIWTYAAARAAASVEQAVCGGVTIGGVRYDRLVLKSGLDRPYSLAVDFGTNTLYFSYSLDPNDDLFQTAKINLNTNEYAKVDGAPNGFVQTVDQKSGDVYIGTSSGIYVLGRSSDIARDTGAKSADVWDIYHNDVLYFTEFPSQRLHVARGGQVARFKLLEHTKVIHFALDSDNAMIYTNATGLYGQPLGSDDAYLYKELENGDKVRALANDMRGDVHACFDDGIYKVRTGTGTLELVLPAEAAFGVAFDANNAIVYSNATSIFHLRPNRDKGC